MDPRVAYDIIQRLPHLAIRMREHSRRASRIAALLEDLGVAVIYPGLSSHPQHALVSELLNEGYGFGGVIAIDCGSQAKADAFLDRLQNEEDFGYIAVSLGYYDTLMSCSSATTSSEIPDEEQTKMGLSQGLVRMSVGFTGTLEARLAQVERAVKAVGLGRT
jgi:methionine-gamma-lyase